MTVMLLKTDQWVTCDKHRVMKDLAVVELT